MTGREPSAETLNVSVVFNTFLRIFPGWYGESLIVISTDVSRFVVAISILPLEKA